MTKQRPKALAEASDTNPDKEFNMKSFACTAFIPTFALFVGLPTISAFAATVPAASAPHVAYPGPANPTGLPSYLMRPDGLMINGLLPANGWEG